MPMGRVLWWIRQSGRLIGGLNVPTEPTDFELIFKKLPKSGLGPSIGIIHIQFMS